MSKTLKEKILVVADKGEEYSLYAIAFFIPISIALLESFVCLALLAFIIKKIILPDFTFIKSRIHFFLLLFFIFCGLSLLNSGLYIDKSFHALFGKWGQYILIFFLVQDALASSKRIRNTMRIFLLAGCLVAVDGISQHFFGYEFLRGRQIITTKQVLDAVTGPFHHYNNLAAYLICIFALFMAAISIKSSSHLLIPLRNKVIFCGLSLGLFLSGACILLTFSRGGWIGLLFAVLLMLILSGKWKVILPIFCTFIFLLISIPVLRERAALIFASDGDASRFAIWKGAWGMIKEHPFLGKGIGTFMANFSQYTKGLGVQYAHNCYLQIWAETGVFSLLSFISFLSLLLWQGVKAFRKSHDYIVLGVFCAIFGFLVHGFFDTHFYSLQLAVLFWFMAGMLVTVSKDRIL